jgi:hypothetical protein
MEVEDMNRKVMRKMAVLTVMSAGLVAVAATGAGAAGPGHDHNELDRVDAVLVDVTPGTPAQHRLVEEHDRLTWRIARWDELDAAQAAVNGATPGTPAQSRGIEVVTSIYAELEPAPVAATSSM